MVPSPLAVSALALLFERPMHPYEMFQLLVARSKDRLVKVRPGTLYHAIDRLVAEGLARATGTARAGNRPERTTYELTDAGRDAVRGWVRTSLAEPADEFPRFPVALAEAHNLSGDEVVELLRRRVVSLRDDDDFLAAGEASVIAAGAPERYWFEVPYQRAVLAAEIDWLERAVDRLAAGAVPWTPVPAAPSPLPILPSTAGTP